MSLGHSNSGKNRLANLTLNGRRQPSSPNDVRDSSKHSNYPPGRITTTLDEAVLEETTTGGTIETTDAPPLKEDTIWTSTLQSPKTSMPLPVDNNIPKQRKQNSCEATHASTAKNKDTELTSVARNRLTAVTSVVAPTTPGSKLESTPHPLCQIFQIPTFSLTI